MLSDDNTSNPKRFWSFIKGNRTESTGVAPLRREGILHSDTATKANILSDQFTSVFHQNKEEIYQQKKTALIHLY
jgi:hypothetical protein